MEELFASVTELAAAVRAQGKTIKEIEEWSKDIYGLLSGVSAEVTRGEPFSTAAEFEEKLDSIEETVDSTAVALESTARTVESMAQALAILNPVKSSTAS
ncbi:hypothetical protein [Synechococcus sp. MW101C3]|uniref:hypothetical protein n=1 Tax=Synechococcus sp. MW101C3 TaxID=210768 RepID=UPI000B99107B|nr:hypothetical protein [Synechococcus sp. MW101C3]